MASCSSRLLSRVLKNSPNTQKYDKEQNSVGLEVPETMTSARNKLKSEISLDWYSSKKKGIDGTLQAPMLETPRADLKSFNSFSLNRHLSWTYNFDNGVSFGDGFVEVLAATQTPGEAGKRWFQGTADAIRQFIWVFEANAKNKNVENILILSGDHLHWMNYMNFVQKHIDTNADITVSCVPMDDSRASSCGLMTIDRIGRIIQFAGKPKGNELKAMQVDSTLLGLSKQDAVNLPYIASMGIYVCKTDVLLKLLRWSYPSCNDFGSEIISSTVAEHNVQAYLFNDYWEDIGTIKSFFDTNLALTESPPKFEFYDPQTPFYTSSRFLPPVKLINAGIP
ncbi:hypothetical protein EUGRSUZ_E03793 [Eucalyptus grandis]|uniref:Uncharacterized protein n=2 Tax=Eucalyptus grandis TaxID=71139 RepID=A0ACC3L0J9_EUCGR|nr:hypothetical protein EUGRSUZ_E03793 [Eucalyptus grandis]